MSSGRTEAESRRRVLESWKAIAAHLGVSVRTVQLWERDRGLPVHRRPGEKGRVWAVAGELEEWLDHHAREPETIAVVTKGRRRVWTIGVVAAAAILAVVVWVLERGRAGAPVSSVAVINRSLLAMDANGERLWVHEFPMEPMRCWVRGASKYECPQLMPVVADIDGDGRREVLFAYLAHREVDLTSEVYCFEADGRIRWRFRPGKPVVTGHGRYGQQYLLRSMLPWAGKGGNPLVLVISTHEVEYPSQLAALSVKGEVVREYWHSGHLVAMAPADLEDDGRAELYVTAIRNNGKDASIVVLDPEEFGGAARETGSPYQISGMAEPVEVARVVLPSSALKRGMSAYASPAQVRIEDRDLWVSVMQAQLSDVPQDNPSLMFRFGPRLELKDLEHSWNFPSAVEVLNRKGLMKPVDLEAERAELMRRGVEFLTKWREP